MKKLPIVILLSALVAMLTACEVVGEVDSLGGGNNSTADAGPGGGNGDGGGGDAVAGLTPQQVRLNFGSCMDLTEWDNLQMGEIALVQADDNGTLRPCTECHAAGIKPVLTDTSANTFNLTKVDDLSLQRYVLVDLQLQLTANDILATKGQIAGHPTYTLPDPLPANITEFFNLTKARLDLEPNGCPQQ